MYHFVFQSPRTPSEVGGGCGAGADVPVTVAAYAHVGSPQLSDDEPMVCALPNIQMQVSIAQYVCYIGDFLSTTARLTRGF